MDTVKAFAWLLFMLQIMSCSLAYEFTVGGKDGWVLNPHESYTQWSGRNRFQVHDKLVFKYKKGDDSVLLVSKEDYDNCNVSNPIKKFDDGNSVLEFDKTGPFFFISGAPGKCNQGQKLSVVVISLKTNKKPNTSPAPSPTSPVSSQPPSSSSPSPSSEASSPSASPEASPTPSISISPSATMGSPVSSQSQSPSPSSGASSGVPSSLSPGQSSEPTNAASSPGSSPASPQSPAPALATTWMSFGWITLVFCALFLE